MYYTSNLKRWYYGIHSKNVGYVLYAVGIIGGVEGATMRAELGRDMAIITSVIALVVIIIGAYLIEKK